MIVDDEELLLTMSDMVLSSFGYRVLTAENGRAALDIMQHMPRPHLVVVDCGVPGIDGYSVCQQLKSSPDTAAIPVIILQREADGRRQALAAEIGYAEARMAEIRALAEAKINVEMINTSEVRVNVVVDGNAGERGLAALQTAFEDTLR